METEIYACMFCLSRELDFIPKGDRSWSVGYGMGVLSGHAKCRKCGRYLLPITFKSEEDYKKAKEALGK
ncbi:MAG: hypothetical protein ABIH83_03085 [Candidatus Micrarchaeota archaeon]